MGDQESYTVSFVSYWKYKPSSQKSVQKIQKFDETTFTHNAPNIVHAIRNYKQSGSTEWSSKNDFESRNFKCKTSRNLSLSLSSQRDRI